MGLVIKQRFRNLYQQLNIGWIHAMSAIPVLRARIAPVFARRLLNTTACARNQGSNGMKPPQPPKPIDDSTSALDYKRTQRYRPPPLPATDVPRSRTAEEAVTNILYNTPPPSLQPFKK